MTSNLHPTHNRMVPRGVKETLLKQKAHVFWFYGLSGSGKSTLSLALEKELTEAGFHVKALDGDNLRSGLNEDLGFSDMARRENIRRVAEVSKLFIDAGTIVLASFITPLREFRMLARDILGSENVSFIYTEASFATCADRDVKGLYAKAKKGEIRHFTGSSSDFEPPTQEDPDWLIRTDDLSEQEALHQLNERIRPLVANPAVPAHS